MIRKKQSFALCGTRKHFEVSYLTSKAQDALIETLNDQAFELYLKLSYLPVSTFSNYVGNFTRQTLIKSLT